MEEAKILKKMNLKFKWDHNVQNEHHRCIEEDLKRLKLIKCSKVKVAVTLRPSPSH